MGIVLTGNNVKRIVIEFVRNHITRKHPFKPRRHDALVTVIIKTEEIQSICFLVTANGKRSSRGCNLKCPHIRRQIGGNVSANLSNSRAGSRVRNCHLKDAGSRIILLNEHNARTNVYRRHTSAETVTGKQVDFRSSSRECFSGSLKDILGVVSKQDQSTRRRDRMG